MPNELQSSCNKMTILTVRHVNPPNKKGLLFFRFESLLFHISLILYIIDREGQSEILT